MKKIEQKKIIIIGGGMAGISAALKLKEHGKDFLMITDTLGGRVKYSREENVNLGAYFVMNRYHNTKKVLKKEKWLNPFDASFREDEDNMFQALSFTMLSLMPQILKYLLALLRFELHYKKFKRNCTVMTHIEALKADKYLSKLSSQSSSDFIAEKKLHELADAMIFKFAYSCTLTPPENMSAFDMLTPCEGLLIQMFKFSFDEQGMAKKLSKELIKDKVVSIEKKGDTYEVKTEKGKIFLAEYIIIATQADVAKKLLGLTQIRNASSASVFHLKGEPFEKYSTHTLNSFSTKFEICMITKEANNTFLVFSRNRDIDLSKYFKKWEIISKTDWDTALYVKDNYLLEQNFNENITIAGDHNSCGLEPACIAGIYAANRILKRFMA